MRAGDVRIPSCQGDARFTTREHAEYVARNVGAEFGTDWLVVEHGDHFHVHEVRA